MKLKTFFTATIFTILLAVPVLAFSKIEGYVTSTYENRVVISTENGNHSILLEDAAILKSKRLINSEDIKEGDKLLVVYEEGVFSPLIYPPQKTAHTALVRRNNYEADHREEHNPGIVNMLELLPFYARGTNANLIGMLEDIIDINYYTGLEVF